MTSFQITLMVGFGLLVVLAASRLFKGPFRWAMRAALHTLLGIAALVAFHFWGGGIGLSLGLTLVNIAVVSLLGVPGFGLLLFAQWLF